jgi:D-methionine transport system ATP-binding protein
VAIARALPLNPKVLLCDEATSSLAPNMTKSILQLLRRINSELQLTIIVVTHQMSIVKQVCHKMAILSKGKLNVSGRVEDIFLDKPDILYEILGADQDNYPENGVNLEILRR